MERRSWKEIEMGKGWELEVREMKEHVLRIMMNLDFETHLIRSVTDANVEKW